MRTGTIVAIGLLLVLTTVAGFGLLIGSSLGNQGQPTDAETPVANQQSDTGMSEPGNPTAAPETATATPTPKDEQTESVSVNQSQLVMAIETRLNKNRSFANEFNTDSITNRQLASMAEAHSQDMAGQQFLSHNVGNGNSQDRYERNDLFDQCVFKKESYIEDASDNDFEVIGRVSIDAHASGSSDSLEARLAEALVSDWEASPRYNERISYENADAIGVGVALSNNDEVYATVNLC